MPIATIPSDRLIPTLECRESSAIWRSLESAAEACGAPVTAWPAWRVQDADGPESDLLEFAMRRGKPFAFAALVDLGFHFHWPMLPREHHETLKVAFENAIALADTIFMLDVAPPGEDPERATERLSRRADVSSCLTEALVIYLRRAPETAREDELARFGGATLLDEEIIAAVKQAHRKAAALNERAHIARSMGPIEQRARQAAGRGRL